MRFDSFRCRWRAALGLSCLALATFTIHAVEVTSGPTLVMDPNGTTPLAGVVEFTTDVPVTAQLTITFGSDVRVVDFPQSTQQHYLPVLGLKPDRTYTVDIDVNPGGPIGTLFATTDPLPDDFPTLVANISIPDQMEPGYTLIDCFSRGGGDPRPRYGTIVDSAGEVVWYTLQCFTGNRQLPNGDLLARVNEDLLQMDLLGNLQVTTLADPGVGLHHDLEPTPDGTYLSLSRRAVDVPDFPTSETDPNAPTALTTVRDEPVVEFLPDGTVRQEWSLLAMLDETRIAYNSLVPTSAGVDSIHTNAVTYNPDDDSIVVSARHQDAVFKFSRATGELIWILGNHNNWSSEFEPYLLHPIGSPFLWQYHQHAPMWTGDGTLLLFDNGNFRASPFDGTTPDTNEESFSRGVEYEINETNMHVRQVWEYGEFADDRLFSFFISDADWQPQTGNRLMTFGGTRYVNGVLSADLGKGLTHTRIIEATGDLSATPVFDLEFYDPTGPQVTVYRSERIPSLYPPVHIMPPHGVRGTLRLDRGPATIMLTWEASLTDSEHSAADHYRVYTSTSPGNGFAMVESTAELRYDAEIDETPLLYYLIVAANHSGTSTDVPAP